MVNTDQIIAFLQTLEPVNFATHPFHWVGIHPNNNRTRAAGTLEEVLPNLIKRNQQGYGIFVAVNALDTPNFEDGYARRRKEDISRIRAVFADWDTPDKPVPDLPLQPTMVVTTSEGKYHMYWCVEDMALEDFEPTQRAIVAQLGSDASGVDLSRILRVPGFMHTKDLANQHMVELSAQYGPRYSAATIKEAFPPQAARPKFSTWSGVVERKAALTAAVIGAMYLPRTDGGYNIVCPWEHLHTGDKGTSDCTYWPPNESNNGRGSYVCMHAHCRGIHMVDELDAWVAQRVKQAFA